MNGIQEGAKVSQNTFQPAGLSGLLRDQKSLSAVGCNTLGIFKTVAASAAAARITLADEKIPAGSTILGYKITAKGAHTIATGTHLSLGTNADPDLIAIHAIAELNAAGKSVFAWLDTPINVTADTELQFAPTNSSGVEAGTIVGEYCVQVVGVRLADVDLEN